MPFSIIGFDSTYKVPKFAAQLIFGAGTQTGAALPMVCLLVGMKTAAGSQVVDQDITYPTTIDEVDANVGAGSQLARMAYKSLLVPGVQIAMAACTEATGTYATVTVLLAGAWTLGGTWQISVAGELLTGPVLATDTLLSVGAAMAAAINAKFRWPCTATFAVATLTVTCNNKGTQGTLWSLFFDPSLLPAGMTATVTGSATLGTNTANRVSFGAAASGTGTESYTALLTKLLTRRYARTAVAAVDATNSAAFLAQVNTKAGATQLLLDQIVFGQNRAYAAAQTLAQTNLNGVRASVLWAQNSEAHPSEIAAAMAAYRSAVENATAFVQGGTPIFNFDGFVLPGLPPQRFDSDVPNDASQNTALQNGVTPMVASGNGLAIVRAITTKSLTNALPDFRSIDIGDVVVPDQFALDVASDWYLFFKVSNPLVGDDPAIEDPALPSGVAYPKLWTAELNKILGAYYANGWIENPANNPPVSYFDGSNKRIMSTATLVVRRIQHQLGQRILQQQNA